MTLVLSDCSTLVNFLFFIEGLTNDELVDVVAAFAGDEGVAIAEIDKSVVAGTGEGAVSAGIGEGAVSLRHGGCFNSRWLIGCLPY